MQFLVDCILILIYFSLTLLVFVWCWRFWLLYAQQRHLAKIDWIIIEIKLPREINKSPIAMEMALSSFTHTSGMAPWFKRNILGNLPLFSSLEIASIEGTIHFYMRIQRRFRNLVESNLYAHYPGIEITEAEDYTKLIHYHHLSTDVETWSASYPLGATWAPTNPETGQPWPDPEKPNKPYTMKADFLPIKTYVDFGLDRDPKEEFKLDPMTPLLEFLGSVGKGEHVWYQILVQDEGNFNGEKAPKMYVNEMTHEHLSLADIAGLRKKQLRRVKKVKKGDAVYDEFGHVRQKTVRNDDGTATNEPITYAEEREIQEKPEMQLTTDEKEELERINLKLSKPIMRIIVRITYVAKKQAFNPQYVSNILMIMKNFNGFGNGRNSFGLQVCDPYDYPWDDPFGQRVPWRKEEFFENYVEREGFHVHFGDRPGLERWEDSVFFPFTLKSRKIWRMAYEAFFHPFGHPTSTEISCVNLEELATLYHFPGQVASVPTLPRIDSAKSVAPTNLPQ